jgi:hypothetical protein
MICCFLIAVVLWLTLLLSLVAGLAKWSQGLRFQQLRKMCQFGSKKGFVQPCVSSGPFSSRLLGIDSKKWLVL